MTAPQIIMAVYLLLIMIAAAILHGKPRTGNNHIGIGWCAALALFGVLWWGGFWQ